MTTFLIVAALVVAASLALLARPWWWRRHEMDVHSRRALNTAIYGDQLAEVERDRTSGELSDTDYQEARNELQRRLLEDAAEADAKLAATAHPKRTLLALMVALPLLSAGFYAWLGNPSALNPAATTPEHQVTQQDIEKMVAGLAAKLQQEPGNLKGWVMLARSYKALQRYPEAAKAYEKGYALVETDSQLLADYADVLAASTGGLAGRSEELVKKALTLDPNNVQALWMLGSAAFRRQDFATAIELWERGVKALPPGSEDAQALTQIIEEARVKMGAAGATPTAATKAAPAAAAAGAMIRGNVELAPGLKAKAAADDVVFIFARAVDGPPMPLAAKRVRVADLPMEFTLSDSDSPMPQAKLSSAKSVRIEARVAKGGDAKPRPGDLSGSAGPVSPGATGLRVVIDTVVQ